jgi:hypothetical protein
MSGIRATREPTLTAKTQQIPMLNPKLFKIHTAKPTNNSKSITCDEAKTAAQEPTTIPTLRPPQTDPVLTNH